MGEIPPKVNQCAGHRLDSGKLRTAAIKLEFTTGAILRNLKVERRDDLGRQPTYAGRFLERSIHMATDTHVSLEKEEIQVIGIRDPDPKLSKRAQVAHGLAKFEHADEWSQKTEAFEQSGCGFSTQGDTKTA